MNPGQPFPCGCSEGHADCPCASRRRLHSCAVADQTRSRPLPALPNEILLLVIRLSLPPVQPASFRKRYRLLKSYLVSRAWRQLANFFFCHISFSDQIGADYFLVYKVDRAFNQPSDPPWALLKQTTTIAFDLGAGMGAAAGRPHFDSRVATKLIQMAVACVAVKEVRLEAIVDIEYADLSILAASESVLRHRGG